jgi:hypothetical protein
MTQHSLSLVLLTVLLAAAAGVNGAETPDAGMPFDLQGLVEKEIKAGAKKIVVPPGRYRVTPKNREHLRLADLEGIEIVADGVEMVCTETTRALSIVNCRNVTVRGLTMDYDPLPFTQGRIVALADDRKWLDVELFEGYPDEGVKTFKFEIFDPATNTLRTETYYGIEVEKKAPRQYRFSRPAGFRYDANRHIERVGDIVVTGVELAPHGSIPHAVTIERCTSVTLSDVTLYASNCFGFLEVASDATRYVRCRIDRCAPKDDVRTRSWPRVRSLNADAYHSKHAVRGPAYEECIARYQGDDCVAINGDYHMIMGSQGKTLRVLAKHDLNVQVGDPVELVTYQGQRLPDAKVTAVQRDGTIKDEERAFLAKQRMNDELKAAKSALTKAFTLTLDRDVEIAMGGVLCSANRIGNGFVVKGGTFGFNRSRGILVKASHGEITGNRLDGCWEEAIKVSPEYWWLEAGSSNDVKITNNTVVNCRSFAISVWADGGRGQVAPAGAHNDIVITGNTVRDCPMPGILVTSTIGLRLEENTLENLRARPGTPWFLKPAGLKEQQAVVEINVERRKQ